MAENIHWLDADSNSPVTNYNGNAQSPCSLDELVENSNGVLYFQYKDDPLYYTNVCSDSAFTINGNTAELAGGIHSPQRPK